MYKETPRSLNIIQLKKNTFELQYNKMKSKYNNYTSPCQEQKTNPSLHHKQK
jgi:hypothetical protein